MKDQIKRIRDAYNLTLWQYNNDIDPFQDLPKEFTDSPEFKEFIAENQGECCSGSPEIKNYLNPQIGMKYLDLGCAASLVSYQLYKWDSEYYGIDISDQLIRAMDKFVEDNQISIGGLFVGEINKLPFRKSFFDIAACVGVLEYFSLEYNEQVLSELHRVARPGGRVVLDIPNEDHKHYHVMLRLEELLDRPIIPYHISDFEEILLNHFIIMKTDARFVMKRYYLENKVD